MPTKIGALQPRATPTPVVTFAGADWRDAFPFQQAGAAAGYPGASNGGNGSVIVTGVAPQTVLGAHELQIVSAPTGEPAQYTVSAPNGLLEGIGRVGVPLDAGGLTLTLSAGPIPFRVGDTFAIGVTPEAIDVTGIAFALMWRVLPAQAGVVLDASTDNGLILNGGADGTASMAVPYTQMQDIAPGTYVYDLVAQADGARLVVYHGTITHMPVVTRPSLGGL